ncbi:hypothetical protein FS749_011935 [Ceratobasidium sp. UAMH 11750]|nr:hypothetical protein FS749_011935 [Ceratobasidium sp. UAMH 11750]
MTYPPRIRNPPHPPPYIDPLPQVYNLPHLSPRPHPSYTAERPRTAWSSTFTPQPLNHCLLARLTSKHPHAALLPHNFSPRAFAVERSTLPARFTTERLYTALHLCLRTARVLSTAHRPPPPVPPSARSSCVTRVRSIASSRPTTAHGDRALLRHSFTTPHAAHTLTTPS